jgi:hypothetical protein
MLWSLRAEVVGRAWSAFIDNVDLIKKPPVLLAGDG